MRAMLVVLLLLPLSGCASDPADENNPVVQSDRSAYLIQSYVDPAGLEPNYTPYGTPANAGTNSDYGRSLRPDSVSDYSYLWR